jgi:phenylacetate-CoA ligase
MKSRLAGTLTVLRRLPGQRRVPFLPPHKVAAARDARVRDTVRYAADSVPYYRDVFARDGIDPRELRTAGDLARLPIIDKQTLFENTTDFRAESRAGNEAVCFRTSGFVTGRPVDIYHDRASLLANVAFSERERAVEAAYCGRRVRYAGAELRYHPAAVRSVQSSYERALFRPLRPGHHAVPIDPSIERMAEIVNSLRPEALRSYGSYLEAFFRLVAARGLPIHRPKVVVYSSDRMSPEGRAFIEEHFGVPVLSRYNAVEAFKIGFFCEARAGFHLHEDLCHVVLVDADGRPVPSGAQGEVVISNLVNRGTVLLNYRLGDVARMTDEPCTCGRTSRRLLDVDGRMTDLVRLPSGDVVHQFGLWGALKLVDGVVRYQLVQREPARFELRLMTVDRAAYDRVADVLAARASELLQGAAVEVEYREHLALERGGKFRPVIPLAS